MTDGEALPQGDLLEEYYSNLHDAYDAMRTAFQQRRITQDEIARRLGVDKALISKRLNGQENLTLKTLSFMASAMECLLSIHFTPYEEVKEPAFDEAVIKRKDETTTDATVDAPPRELRLVPKAA